MILAVPQDAVHVRGHERPLAEHNMREVTSEPPPAIRKDILDAVRHNLIAYHLTQQVGAVDGGDGDGVRRRPRIVPPVQAQLTTPVSGS